jgi:hypothetical protein
MLTEVTNKAYCDAIRMMFSGKPVAVGMKQYCEYLQTILPHPIWEEIKDLPFNEEVQRLNHRLSAVFTTEPPSQNVKLFYFGLSDLGDNMYLSGIENYNIREDGTIDPDKIVEDWPRDYNSKSEILTQMHKIVEKTEEEVHWIGEACLPLVFIGLSVSYIFCTLPSNLLLQGGTPRQVAVCFDEGDLFLLGEIQQNGWHYLPEPTFLKMLGSKLF